MRRLTVFVSLLVAGPVLAGWFFDTGEEEIAGLKGVAVQALAGAQLYSSKVPFSKTIGAMYLGFNKNGKPCSGVAMRYFKSYEKVTAMVVVERKEGSFVLSHADIPDITKIRNVEKQQKVLGAIKDVHGIVVHDEQGNDHRIDAVTGATRYQKRIYLSFNLMAKNLVETMENPPDWPKQPLTLTSR